MSRAQKAVVGTIVAVAVLGVLIGIYFASGGKGGSGERRAFCVPPHAGARQVRGRRKTAFKRLT